MSSPDIHRSSPSLREDERVAWQQAVVVSIDLKRSARTCLSICKHIPRSLCNTEYSCVFLFNKRFLFLSSYSCTLFRRIGSARLRHERIPRGGRADGRTQHYLCHRRRGNGKRLRKLIEMHESLRQDGCSF